MSVRTETKEVIRTWKDKTGNVLTLLRWVVCKDYENIKANEYRLAEITPEGCCVFSIEIGPNGESCSKRLERWMDLIAKGSAI